MPYVFNPFTGNFDYKPVGTGGDGTTIVGGLVPKGAYDGATTYIIGDSVDYNGSSYVMYDTALAGTLPTDTDHWQVVASQGIVGDQGPIGPTGPAGADGSDGATGPTGAKGDKGDQGDTGAAGADGLDGNDGATGAQGIQGIQGETGATGAKGDTGDQGIQGLTGATGSTGPQGPAGNDGATGPEGPQGPIGNTGPAGSDGTNGTNGTDGDSAYDIAVAGGFVGSEAAWLLSLEGSDGVDGTNGSDGATGATGDQGIQGIQGIQGPAGNDGADGATGAKGDKGDTGDTGPQGDQGIQGVAGPAGSDGAPGPEGPQGPTGATGATGAAGADGSDASVTKPNVEAVLTGEITSHTHPAGSAVSKYRETYSGRVYCYTDNRWITGHDDNYGWAYYQFSESGGTGTNPIDEWEHQGMPIPAGTKLKKLWIKGRVNNTEVTDMEICVYETVPSTTDRWAGVGVDNDAEVVSTEIHRDLFFSPANGGTAFTGATNDIHLRKIDLDYTFTEDSELRIYYKPVGTITATRYFLHNVLLEFEI